MPIRLGPRQGLGAYVAARTRLVFNDDRLFQMPGEVLGDLTTNDVGHATRGKWNDDGDGARRII